MQKWRNLSISAKGTLLVLFLALYVAASKGLAMWLDARGYTSPQSNQAPVGAVEVDSIALAQGFVRARLVPNAPVTFLSSRRTRITPPVYCGKVATEDVEGHADLIRWIVTDTVPITEWRVGRDSMDLLWLLNCS